ncbi:MAG: hypothetical protein BHV91_02675 [Clostridiales bacterium 44_9]|nr:MAG: hypothetical protein BHV91_02675 [Clostridiales bacterium 44_9]
MLKIENTEVVGWEAVIRGMRNPLNSWQMSDSIFVEDGEYHDICGNSGPYNGTVSDTETFFEIGPKDYDLMTSLCNAGTDHRKFMRMITVYLDITAPLYWWKEFDTYKVGTVANSCSTMHKIADKEFTFDDFSHEKLINSACMEIQEQHIRISPIQALATTIECLNSYRDLYLQTKDKKYWWQMIQLLPSSYNQKRTVMLNYEVLANIYKSRKDHKLDEWHKFCNWIERLPYSELITGNKEE